MDAVYCRRSALVKLTGNKLNCNVLLAREIHIVTYSVGNNFSKDGVTAFFYELRGKTKEVVNIDQPKGTKVQGQVLVKLCQQAAGLNVKLFPFFYKQAGAIHYNQKDMPTGAGAWWAYWFIFQYSVLSGSAAGGTL